jgi:hypothetical protein
MRRALPLVVALLLGLPAAGAAMTPSPPPPTSELIRLSADGKRTALVAADVDEVAGSPDGRRIAFTNGDGLWLTNGTRASNRLVRTGRGAALELSWAGNGRRLAFERCTDERSATCIRRVSVLDVRTGTTVMLPFAASGPSLSPDGKRIAVVLQPSGTSVIATTAGRILVRLGRLEEVRFAPRGRLLAYVDPTGWLCVMRDDGRERRCLARGVTPVWSPRGTQLAFQVSPNYGFDWRFAVVGVARPRRVRALSPWFHWPLDLGLRNPNAGISWSPDGRRVAFGGGVLWVVPGRTREPVGSGSCEALDTAFTRAGDVVYRSYCQKYGGGL